MMLSAVACASAVTAANPWNSLPGLPRIDRGPFATMPTPRSPVHPPHAANDNSFENTEGRGPDRAPAIEVATEGHEPDRSHGIEVVGYADGGCGGAVTERTVLPFTAMGIPHDASCADTNTMVLAQLFIVNAHGCADPLTAATLGTPREVDWCCRMTRNFPGNTRSGEIVGCFDAENPNPSAPSAAEDSDAARQPAAVHPPHRTDEGAARPLDAVHPPHRTDEGAARPLDAVHPPHRTDEGILVGNPGADGQGDNGGRPKTAVLRGRVVDISDAGQKIDHVVHDALAYAIPQFGAALRELIISGFLGDSDKPLPVVAEEGFGY